MGKKKGKNAKGKGGSEGATASRSDPTTVAEASTSQTTPGPEKEPVPAGAHQHRGEDEPQSYESRTAPSASDEGQGHGRGDGRGRGRGRGGRFGDTRPSESEPEPGGAYKYRGEDEPRSYERQTTPSDAGEGQRRGRGDGRGRGRGRGGRGGFASSSGDTRPPGSESDQYGDTRRPYDQPPPTHGPGRGQQRQGPWRQQPEQQQQQLPGPPGQRGSWRKESGPPQGAVSTKSADIGPTPSEGPQRFQATGTTRAAVPSQPPASDQKLVSIQKGLADMTVGAGDKPRMGKQPTALQIPHRKNYSVSGTSGRRVKILTNHLALDLSALSQMTVMHYDVAIDPDKPKRLLRMAVNAAKKELFPNRNPAFDGKKNLYSSGLLPFGNDQTVMVNVWDDEREREKEYTVTFKVVSKIDMDSLTNYMKLQHNQVPKIVPQTAIQALDIILRSAPAFSLVQVGRSFFSPPRGQVHNLGNGLEVWHGIFQSAIIGWKPFVNIDVAHKGFPKAQNCLKLIEDLKNPFDRDRANLNAELGMHDKDNLMKFLRELKVNYEIPGNPTSKRTYRVNGIGKSARTQRFAMEDGTEMSVEEYYYKNKKFRLQYPLMPVLDVGSPLRIKKIYIPLELCTVKEGQVVIKKMNETQTAEMIKVAATSSDDRKRKIMDALKTIDFNSDPCVGKEFKVKVASDFEAVESRVLDPPSLMYAQNREVTPKQGVWFADKFFEGKPLQKWTILNLSRIHDQDLRNFADQMQTQGRRAGMDIAPPIPPFYNIQLSRRPDDLKGLEQQFLDYKRDGMELVFCVVEEKGDAYAQVKRMAELKIGVLTQCVKAVTIQRRMRSPATANNILMKVNSKLNGKNHCFTPMSRPQVLKTPTIILGADVTHPPPDQTNMPSVAAVCASHDPKAFQYNLQYRLQPPRMEIIEDLEAIMKEQLLFFYKKNKQKPLKIIFYRDGVSEGQFNDVLNVEFMAIRRACKSLQADYEPGITFLVVQKRHHTRFFPDPNNPNRLDHDGRNNNVPAGTIVDTVITHPTDMDFYLVSHASIQGVSRPTKYRRLWDDNNIPEDELELLTYYLCHLFSRCTRSVSYPAPTYYAHLAAYRVRCYIEMGNISIHNLAQEQENRKILDCILKEFPMFFV